jgi:hypothetical protein
MNAAAKPDPKPDPKPAPPDCTYGSDPKATAHTFAVFVQGDVEPELVVTFCTRCGQIAQDRKP